MRCLLPHKLAKLEAGVGEAEQTYREIVGWLKCHNAPHCPKNDRPCDLDDDLLPEARWLLYGPTGKGLVL